MGTYIDRLKIVLDWDGKAAETGSKSFVAAIREADGASAKLKAGWKSATDSIKANAGLFSAAAGAAIVGLGVKAVNSFTTMSKAAIDFGKAAGMGVEDASRWMAVADDYAISADGIATATARISRSLDDEKWAKYGIATRDAGGHARSTNDIFLDVLDTVGRMPNATERSAAMFELMGKGWQSIAPLVGKTRAEYEAMLADVEDGLVTTEAEAAAADKWRLALDDLGDSLTSLLNQLGGVIAGGARFVGWVTTAINSVSAVTNKVKDVTHGFLTFGNVIKYTVLLPLTAAVKVVDLLSDAFGTNYVKLDDLAGGVAGYAERTQAATAETDAHAEAIRRAGDMYGGLEDAIREADEALQEHNDTLLASVDANFAAQKAHDDFLESLDALAVAADDPKTSVDEYAQALSRSAESAIHAAEADVRRADEVYKAQGVTITAEDKQRMLIASLTDTASTLAPGSPLLLQLQQYILYLQSVPANITTSFHTSGLKSSKSGSFTVDNDTGAAGGTFEAGSSVDVGEHGKERVIFGARGTVLPAYASGAGGAGAPTVYITVNAGMGTDPASLARAVADAVTRAVKDGYRASWTGS